MRSFRRSEIQAGMRTLTVLYPDDLVNILRSIFMLLISPFGIEIVFQESVYPFGQSVIVGTAVLGHTYSDSITLKHFGILIAAVLDPTVRMMGEVDTCFQISPSPKPLNSPSPQEWDVMHIQQSFGSTRR